ncbi:DUF1660 family phage protein [Baekduia soli]|uniref:DUF1660 family phage protein n=1 Tax=Baekduia soli TaxID=496014 RepID=UPI001E602D39|nr:DUF1660 family phage protein [Baekduia soli]
MACRLLGHRWRFRADDRTLSWDCERCAAHGGSKEYPDATAARRYARAFDEEPGRGERRFLLAAAPLWLWRRLRRETR